MYVSITYNVTIFNRWGVKMFESTDLSFEWDGTNKREQNVKKVFTLLYLLVLITGLFA